MGWTRLGARRKRVRRGSGGEDRRESDEDDGAKGTGDGGNEEEADDHAIGKEMTATATTANGRPFLGATAG
jgi:hypothetical protein